ncbi:hypothetical protein TrRE_jg1941 [Triparma retinervis]|uniref:Calmodulin n=1 Tax=Triparma retinervis TaxID=2557542 RepID=A0A9W7E8R7_9STRA|nr:hypothetical protein TrRE_jg1941 [Triparma retinervis]
MFETEERGSRVKLIDFGLSARYNKNEKMTKACGTVYTAAPEVITGKSYTTQTDIWSAGVCAYVLLGQDLPFLKDHEELKDQAKFDRLVNAKYTFQTERWGRISKAGREFVAFCLRKHPGSRWTAKEALTHVDNKWRVLFDEDGVLIDKGKGGGGKAGTPSPGGRGRKRINSVMLRSFEDFGGYSEMKKKVLMTMAHTMDKGGLEELAQMFQDIDVNNEGTITLVELRDALKEKREIDMEKIEKIFKGIDYDRSGVIHYKEFLAAAMESQGLVTQERLLEAFDRMDSDNSGRISKANLKELLGRDYDEELVKQMLGGDEGKEEGIDYEAFLELMFGAKK